MVDSVGTVVRVFQRTSATAPAPRLKATVLQNATVRSEGAGMHAAERSGPTPAAAAQPISARHTARRRRRAQARGHRPAGDEVPSDARVEREPTLPRARRTSLTSARDAHEAARLEPRGFASIDSEAAVEPGAIVIPAEGFAGPHTAGSVRDGAREGAGRGLGQAYGGAPARVVEPGRVEKIGGCAAVAPAPASAVDVEAKGVSAAPDAANPEHVVTRRYGRRVHNLAKVEAHHGSARERVSGATPGSASGSRCGASRPATVPSKSSGRERDSEASRARKCGPGLAE
jgi:hypothetical protein